MALHAFRPRMTSKIRDFALLSPLSWRHLPGLVADVWHVAGKAGAEGDYLSPDPRLVVFLDETPPPLAFHLAGGLPCTAPRALYVPAQVALNSRMMAPAAFSHLDLHIQARTHRQTPHAPRFWAEDATLTTLARLAAAEVRQPSRGDLLLEGLVTAILAQAFDSPAPPKSGPKTGGPKTGGLAPWQVQAVEAHLRTDLTRAVTVAEMAAVAGLSESWFAHGFRQTLNETPQRWQLRLRLQAAREMMADPARPLSDIAQATGFADQAHLSRAFRQAYGLPPSAWRRQGLLPGSGAKRSSPVQDDGQTPE